MKFEIVDYNINKHKLLDEWIDESKYLNAKLINKYAAYSEPISDSYKYFLENPHDMANIKTFIKLFLNEGVIYGIVIFHYYNENNKFYLGINPIIINPDFFDHGIGTHILNQIINQADEITEGSVDVVKGAIEVDNIVSIKLFEKVGFTQGVKNDNFIEYIYEIKNKSNNKIKPLDCHHMAMFCRIISEERYIKKLFNGIGQSSICFILKSNEQKCLVALLDATDYYPYYCCEIDINDIMSLEQKEEKYLLQKLSPRIIKIEKQFAIIELKGKAVKLSIKTYPYFNE